MVTAKDSRRPSSAAASAGITSRVVVVGLMPEIGSISTTATPPSTEATAQLIVPSRSGEIPSSRAPFSLPAAARVATPNRVNRKTAARTIVAPIASAASSSRFWVTVVPNSDTVPSGSTGRRVTTLAPLTGNRRRATSCR